MKLEIGDHFDDGKAPIHLIPVEAIIGIAYGFGYGAEKYGEYNFRKGIKYTKIINSLIRHTLAFLNGEENDQESGKPHTWHIGNNMAMLEWMRVNRPDLDDRPSTYLKKAKNGPKSNKKSKSKGRRRRLRKTK